MTNWNQRITEAREARHLTKAEFARACEVSAPTVTGWESGEIKELTAGKLLKICEVLGVDPRWVVLGKGNFKPSITDGKLPLSNEAKRLISWVERVDALGDPARKFFGHIYSALHVAAAFTQAQNSLLDERLADAEADLPSLTEPLRGKDRANRKHKS